MEIAMDIERETYQEPAELLKAIAHPVRLCIVRGLWQGGGCNVSHMQDCLGIPQSTISQHLQKQIVINGLKAIGNRQFYHWFGDGRQFLVKAVLNQAQHRSGSGDDLHRRARRRGRPGGGLVAELLRKRNLIFS